MSEVCSIAECGRKVSAGGLCATHRRRKRLKLPMSAPIREKVITLSDLLAAAWDVREAEIDGAVDQEFNRLAHRFRRLVRKWAACP